MRTPIENLLLRVSLERFADIGHFNPRGVWNELFALRVFAHNARYEGLVGRKTIEDLIEIGNAAEHICAEAGQ